MRTDAQKLQLMKASFFEHDDIYSAIGDSTTERQKCPDQIVPVSNQFKVSIEKENDMFIGQQPVEVEKEIKQITVSSQILKMIGPQSQPLVDCPRIMPYDIGNLSNSLHCSSFEANLKKNNVSIPFIGKKFKIGWTQGNGFTKLSSPQASFEGQRGGYSNNTITIQEFKPSTSLSADMFKKSVLKHLEIELVFDKKNITSTSECHWLESGGDISGLHEHHQYAQKISRDQSNFHGENIDLSVWSLMNVLWSKINEPLEQQVT